MLAILLYIIICGFFMQGTNGSIIFNIHDIVVFNVQIIRNLLIYKKY